MLRNMTMFSRLLRQDVLGQVLPNVPVAELAGDQRLLIENHLGVTEYGCDCIGVKVRYGYLYIRGSNLSLSYMNSQQLVVCGDIDSIHLQKGGRTG